MWHMWELTHTCYVSNPHFSFNKIKEPKPLTHFLSLTHYPPPFLLTVPFPHLSAGAAAVATATMVAGISLSSILLLIRVTRLSFLSPLFRYNAAATVFYLSSWLLLQRWCRELCDGAGGALSISHC